MQSDRCGLGLVQIAMHQELRRRQYAVMVHKPLGGVLVYVLLVHKCILLGSHQAIRRRAPWYTKATSAELPPIQSRKLYDARWCCESVSVEEQHGPVGLRGTEMCNASKHEYLRWRKDFHQQAMLATNPCILGICQMENNRRMYFMPHAKKRPGIKRARWWCMQPQPLTHKVVSWFNDSAFLSWLFTSKTKGTLSQPLEENTLHQRVGWSDRNSCSIKTWVLTLCLMFAHWQFASTNNHESTLATALPSCLVCTYFIPAREALKPTQSANTTIPSVRHCAPYIVHSPISTSTSKSILHSSRT